MPLTQAITELEHNDYNIIEKKRYMKNVKKADFTHMGSIHGFKTFNRRETPDCYPEFPPFTTIRIWVMP